MDGGRWDTVCRGRKDKKKIIKWIKHGELRENIYIERGESQCIEIGKLSLVCSNYQGQCSGLHRSHLYTISTSIISGQVLSSHTRHALDGLSLNTLPSVQFNPCPAGTSQNFFHPEHLNIAASIHNALH